MTLRGWGGTIFFVRPASGPSEYLMKDIYSYSNDRLKKFRERRQRRIDRENKVQHKIVICFVSFPLSILTYVCTHCTTNP